MRLCRIRLRKIKPTRPAGSSIKPTKQEKIEPHNWTWVKAKAQQAIMGNQDTKITMAKLKKIDEHKILTDFGLNRHLTNQEKQLLYNEMKKVLIEKGNERHLKLYEVDMLCRQQGLSDKDRLDKLRAVARVTPDVVTLPDGTRFKPKKKLGKYGHNMVDIMIYDSHQDIAYQRLQAQGKLPIRPAISLKKHPVETRLKYLDRIIMAPFSNVLWNPVIFYNDPEYEYTIQARYWSQKFGNTEFLIHKKVLAVAIIMILLTPAFTFLEDLLVSKDPNSWYRRNFYQKSFIDFANEKQDKLFDTVGYTNHSLSFTRLFPASVLNPINVKELEIDPDNPGLRRFPIDLIEASPRFPTLFPKQEFIHYNRNITLDQATRVAQFGERPDHNRRLLVTYESMKNMLANNEGNLMDRFLLSNATKRIEEHVTNSSSTLEDIEEKLKMQDEKARRVPSTKTKLIAASCIPLLIGGGIASYRVRKAQSMIDQTGNRRVDWKTSWSPITTMNHMRTLTIREQYIMKLVRKYPKLALLLTLFWGVPASIAYLFIFVNWPTKYIRDGWFEFNMSNWHRDWISWKTTDKDLEYWWSELNRNEFVRVQDVYASDEYLYFYDQGGPVLKSNQIYDHYKAHKDWFKLINNQEWSLDGDYKDIDSVDCPVSEEK